MSGPAPDAAGDLTGRVAFVTGAARNIGRAIAVALAERGADVALGARGESDDLLSTKALVEARGRRALLVPADLSRPGAAARAVEAVAEGLGGLDILVNNAAMRADAPIGEITDESWEAVRSSILDASFFTMRAALPHLSRSGSGAVVNIGGVAAHTGIAGRAHVSAAKAGLAGLTRAAAAELAERGITVNCVSPGRIETARAGAVPRHFVERPSPLGRGGETWEVAELVAFLAGPRGRYLTGQVLHLNGGWHMGA